MAAPGQSASSVNVRLAASAPVLYPSDRTYSPFDATIVQRMRAIAARGSGLRSAVFMKVGDSQSILSYQGWVHCFDGIYDTTKPLPTGNVFYVKLCGRDSLKPAIDYFKSVIIDSATPYGRLSNCTIVGTKASDPLAGAKPTLFQEYAATKPQFALIMFGSNDIQGRLDPNGIEEYEAGLRGIADTLIRKGVIPVLSTMPERMDSDYENFVPAYNGVVRAICQGKQIPFYDVNRELWPLPYHGLAMPGDPVHIKTGGFNEGCFFCGSDTTGYLQIGINKRNLVTMLMLDRIKKVYVDKKPELDPDAVKMTGAGTSASPFIAPSLPFVDMRDNRTSAASSLDNYAGAGTPATAPGPEVLYQFTLKERTPVRMVACDAQKNAVSVHLMSGTSAGSCIANGSRHIGKTLNAGVYYVAVDGNTINCGATYTLSITVCASADTGCGQ